MEQVTVGCGCSRVMTPDALRGRGAYRCGCGARVTVAISSQLQRCVADPDCRTVATAESITEYGLGLCAIHLGTLREAAPFLRPTERKHDDIGLHYLTMPCRQCDLVGYERRSGSARCRHCGHQITMAELEQLRQQELAAAQLIAEAQGSVVYYLRFGERIKIGTSGNLAIRLRVIPHDEVMATEPGNATLERFRHDQFAAHRITGEWFHPSADLLAHIDTLRTHVADAVT